MACRRSFALLLASVIVPLLPAQTPAQPAEVGVVYYSEGEAPYVALKKQAADQSGRLDYSAKVSGAHADVRLQPDRGLRFRVCGVDPTRYKLFHFKSEGKKRTLTIYRANLLTGGARTVFSEAEVPLSMEAAEGGCFTLTPRQPLMSGEYGFSPVGSTDAFMFGVGDAR